MCGRGEACVEGGSMLEGEGGPCWRGEGGHCWRGVHVGWGVHVRGGGGPCSLVYN